MKEAAAYLAVEWKWVRRRIGRKNGPPYVRHGNKFLHPYDEFVKWASQQIIQ